MRDLILLWPFDGLISLNCLIAINSVNGQYTYISGHWMQTAYNIRKLSMQYIVDVGPIMIPHEFGTLVWEQVFVRDTDRIFLLILLLGRSITPFECFWAMLNRADENKTTCEFGAYNLDLNLHWSPSFIFHWLNILGTGGRFVSSFSGNCLFSI